MTRQLPRNFQFVCQNDNGDADSIGIVAFGTEFPDGVVALHWIKGTKSSSLFADFDALQEQYGKDDNIRIEWL